MLSKRRGGLKYFDRALHSNLNLTSVAKMAALMEFDFECVVGAQNGGLSWQVCERDNMSRFRGRLQIVVIVLVEVFADLPLDNGALFNFQIIRNELIVSNYDLVSSHLLFFGDLLLKLVTAHCAPCHGCTGADNALFICNCSVLRKHGVERGILDDGGCLVNEMGVVTSISTLIITTDHTSS